ncbi:MAG: hypothetical protein AAGB11_00715 [Pseudomonadota bacterium]
MRALAFLFAVFATPVLAFEPTGNDAADALLRSLESDGQVVTSVGEVDERSGIITVRDIRTRTVPGAASQGGEAIDLVELHQPELDIDGIYRVALLKTSGYTFTDDDGSSTKIASMGDEDQRLLPGIFTQDATLSEAIASGGRYLYSDIYFNVLAEEGEYRFGFEELAWIPTITATTTHVAGEFRSTGISFKWPSSDEAAAEIARVQKDLGPGMLVMEFDWEAEGGVLDIASLTLSIPGLLDLSLRQNIVGFTVENASGLFPTDGVSTPESLAGVKLDEGSITVIDNGAIDLVVQESARTIGLSPAAVRQMSAELLSGVLLDIGDPEIMGMLSTAATALASGQGNAITITTAPEQPVSIKTLEDITTVGEAMDTLGATLSVR